MSTLEKELISAAQAGDRLAIIKLYNDGVDLNHVNQYGWTALLTACDRAHTEAALLLIDKDAQVNDRGHSNSTPLIRAAWQGMHAVVKALLERRANVNAVDDSHYTPLINAACRGHKDIVDLLIAYGANVNDCTIDRETALHKAAKNGHREIVLTLIENGADLQAVEVNGKTAYDLASEKGFADIMRILRSANANNLIQKEVKTTTQLLEERLNEIIEKIGDLQTQVTDTEETSRRLKAELANDIESRMSDVKTELLKFKNEVLDKKTDLDKTKSKLYMLEMRLNKAQEYRVAQDKANDKLLKNLQGEVYDLKERLLHLKGLIFETRNDWQNHLEGIYADHRNLEELRSNLMQQQLMPGTRMLNFEVDKLMLLGQLNKIDKERKEEREAMKMQLKEINSSWQTRMSALLLDMATYKQEKNLEIEELRNLVADQDRKLSTEVENFKKDFLNRVKACEDGISDAQ